ncbi:hypothetical protein ACFFX0_30520 [Citricoccus parietis]|uniref:Uncharacterized protein n=1 Tax=Citricoccus parietis TaxID=592307 RepID=A0ABV5G9F9_9MICC
MCRRSMTTGRRGGLPPSTGPPRGTADGGAQQGGRTRRTRQIRAQRIRSAEYRRRRCTPSGRSLRHVRQRRRAARRRLRGPRCRISDHPRP